MMTLDSVKGDIVPAAPPEATLSLHHALPCESHQETSQLKLLQALDHPAAVIVVIFDTGAKEGLEMPWEPLGNKAWEIIES